MKNKNRTKIATISSLIGLGSKMLVVFLSFINRKFFLKYLGAELLGINGTLLQVLDTLSLAELGFQTTIIFRLYKPLVEENYEESSKILMFLKKTYLWIGIFIFSMGIILSPFLKFIITKVNVDFRIILISYFIMLIGTAASYLLSYNRALLLADQKNYICNLLDSFTQLIFTIFKIFAIIFFRNYVLFVIIGTANTITSNLLVYLYYKKHYKWIDASTKIDKELTKRLTDDTKNVFIGKIGGYVYNSTDNLIISSVIGTTWVGLVGNYSTITNAIKVVIFGLTSPIQPMLGNYAASNSREETEAIMKKYGFIRFLIALLLLVPTMCLSDVFVKMFYGDEFVLDSAITILLVLDLLIICLQGAAGELIDALGFFKEEKNLYLTYAILNITLSFVGAYFFGIVPIFLATVISQLLSWWWRSKILYLKYYESNVGLMNYWKDQIKYLLFFVFNVVFIEIIIKNIKVPLNIVWFLIVGIMIELFIILSITIFYKNNEEYKYFVNLLHRFLKKEKHE